MRVSLIAALSGERVIGRDGDLPWRLPADLARFKALTMGHHLILGRRTFESIGRLLPGRRILVLTRGAAPLPEGVWRARSLEEALARAGAAGETEVFVGGGAAVYAAALPLADRLYLTWVEAAVEGDTRFPSFDPEAWREVERQDRPADEANPLPLSFRVYERVSGRSEP